MQKQQNGFFLPSAKKAQISSEYLFILAAVLIVSLIVIYIIGESSAPSSEYTEAQSKGYWLHTYPFSIIDYKATGYTLTIRVVNRDPRQITLTGIYVNGAYMYGVPTTFLSKQERTLTFNTGINCANEFSYTLRFTYNVGALTGVSQQGERPVAGRCS